MYLDKDNLTGEDDGDDENIFVNLDEISSEVEKIVFAVVIYNANGKSFRGVKHQRSDRLHKLSCMLTDTYDLITFEDLDMAAMKKSMHFGKSASDNGWGMFVDMLLYKAARKGKLVLFVSKWFPSSKTCHACGHVHKELQLSDRTYECPVCGHVMDRDEQAAKNIDEEGLRIYRQLQSLLFV